MRKYHVRGKSSRVAARGVLVQLSRAECTTRDGSGISMNTSYCDKWWYSRKKAIKEIDADSARLRHANRKTYAALLGGSKQPRHVIDIAGKWVSVAFMDKRLRQYLRYDFKNVSPGRLFLKSTTYWQYKDETDVEVSRNIFSFLEDGRILIEEHDSDTGLVRQRETIADSKPNWEEYPDFGDYSALCKEERVGEL